MSVNSKGLPVDPDHAAILSDDWWLADIEGVTMPVRHAVKQDRMVWTIEGKRVAVISIPEPPDLDLSNVSTDDAVRMLMDWCHKIRHKGKGWLDFSIAVYNDRWVFSNDDKKFKLCLDALENYKQIFIS